MLHASPCQDKVDHCASTARSGHQVATEWIYTMTAELLPCFQPPPSACCSLNSHSRLKWMEQKPLWGHFNPSLQCQPHFIPVFQKIKTIFLSAIVICRCFPLNGVKHTSRTSRKISSLGVVHFRLLCSLCCAFQHFQLSHCTTTTKQYLKKVKVVNKNGIRATSRSNCES